ncbi:MAG: hypothetical protein GF355_14340 [Candidatus Eisenbacteria bacterium]|nr:hypothetical protein [Candidatus Eisenbacteria bacterium]
MVRLPAQTSALGLSIIPAALVLTALAVLAAVFSSVNPLLAFLPLILLVFVVLALNHPNVLVYAMILSTPLFSGMPRGQITPLLKPNEVILLFISILLLVRRVAVASSFHPWSRIDTAFFLFYATRTILPLIFNPSALREPPAISLKFIFGPIQYYLVYRIVLETFTDRAATLRALATAFVAGVVVALIGLLQAADFPGIGEFLRTYYPSKKGVYTYLHSMRITSLFGGDWNGCGLYLSQVILLGLFLHSWSRRTSSRQTSRRLAIMVAVILTALAMTLTFSFSSAIAFAASLAFLSYRLGRLARFLVWLPVVGTAITGAVYLLFREALLQRMALQFGRRSVLIPWTFLYRMYYWKSILMPHILKRPVFGHASKPVEWVSEESYYFFLLVKSGFVGLVGYGAGIYLLFKELGRIGEAADPLTSRTCLLALVLMVELLVANVGGLYFEYSGVTETFWLVVAVAAVQHRLPVSEGDRQINS